MKDAFKEADTEGTGKLTASQLKDVFNAVTTSEWDEELVTLFMRIVDTDGDRMLNYDQLTQLFSDEELEPEQLFKMLFKMLDTNRDGKLCKQELSQLLKIFEDDEDGDRMSEENQQKMKEIIKTFDEDKDGYLNLQEFCTFWAENYDSD